jgi:hypothetical protein
MRSFEMETAASSRLSFRNCEIKPGLVSSLVRDVGRMQSAFPVEDEDSDFSQRTFSLTKLGSN